MSELAGGSQHVHPLILRASVVQIRTCAIENMLSMCMHNNQTFARQFGFNCRAKCGLEPTVTYNFGNYDFESALGRLHT
jgi:hypothetical protein